MFGKTQRGVSKRSNKPNKPLIPHWLWTIFGFLLLASFAVALTLWKPWEPVQPKREIPSEHYQENANKDYRFYDLLPQQQVTPIPEQAVPTTQDRSTVVIVKAPDETPSSVTAAEQATSEALPAVNFILQIRSYEDPDSADARRAEIILNGLSADVVEVTENGKVWYRVVSGPYESQEAAVLAQQTLQNSGIDSIVIKR